MQEQDVIQVEYLKIERQELYLTDIKQQVMDHLAYFVRFCPYKSYEDSNKN
jgi:hypothetical protein